MAAATDQTTATTAGLHGVDKVAALLMTMGRPTVARLIKHFEPEDIRRITKSVADLRPMAPTQIQSLIEEFAYNFAAGTNLIGTATEAQRLLEGILPPDKVSEIMSEVLGNAERSVWERISAAKESILAAFVQREHPQTAALILSKVKSGTAAKVLARLPQDLRNGILRRMIAAKPVTEEAMRIIERSLNNEFKPVASRAGGADSHVRIAEIMNKMDREQVDDVMQNLASTRPKAAQLIKSMMFSFEDLAKLPVKARTAVFDKLSNDLVVLSRRGTDASLRDIVLQSLASRVRRMVEQELNDGRQIPQRDIVAARRQVTDIVLDLASRGEIELSSGGDDDAATA